MWKANTLQTSLGLPLEKMCIQGSFDFIGRWFQRGKSLWIAAH